MIAHVRVHGELNEFTVQEDARNGKTIEAIPPVRVDCVDRHDARVTSANAAQLFVGAVDPLDTDDMPRCATRQPGARTQHCRDRVCPGVHEVPPTGDPLEPACVDACGVRTTRAAIRRGWRRGRRVCAIFADGEQCGAVRAVLGALGDAAVVVAALGRDGAAAAIGGGAAAGDGGLGTAGRAGNEARGDAAEAGDAALACGAALGHPGSWAKVAQRGACRTGKIGCGERRRGHEECQQQERKRRRP
jgi:hypothetical protein